MTVRQLLLAALAAALLAPGPALGVECSVCDRKLVDCRAPAQAKYVACMNDDKSSCNAKCSNDCRDQKEAQRCTLNCVKACPGARSCRVTFINVTDRCSNEYQACKKDCTVPRP
jgi:hypothetical protein